MGLRPVREEAARGATRVVNGRDEPSWRKFEELVAHIEQTLAGSGAVVKSPDKVPDLVTGEPRQVDASIRLTVGSAPILITVECREREGNEDITWIEQMATKRASIGAAKTVAVSSTGFSPAAKEAARFYGIELRTLEDRIGEEIVKQFLSGLRITLIVTQCTTRTIGFQLEDGRVLLPAELGDDLAAALQKDGMGAVVATEVGTGRVLAVNQIVGRVPDHDLPANGPPITKQVHLAFKPHTFTVSTKQGPQFLGEVEIVADYSRRDIPAPASSLYEYATLDRPLRRMIEAVGHLSDTEGLRLLVDVDSPTLGPPVSEPDKPDAE